MDYELAIIGAGPAGYSAGIYAARSGLTSVLFDRGEGGGRAVLSPRIENYAGFELIPGVELMEKMKQHASRYVTLHQFEEVRDIVSSDGSFSVRTAKQSYEVNAIILCTGTEHKTLEIPGEKEFLGRGVCTVRPATGSSSGVSGSRSWAAVAPRSWKPCSSNSSDARK